MSDLYFDLTGTRSLTPNIDALAANGTLFTDFHVAQSFCAPSRASFMTGRYPADLHVNTNWDVGPQGAVSNRLAGLPYHLPLPHAGQKDLYPNVSNVASILQEAGYMTAHFGKWHLGGLSPENLRTPKPSEYGFDVTGTYGSPIQADPSLADEENLPAGNFSDRWWSADVGDFIRDSGIEFMKKAVEKRRPFYLHLWWHMSHDTIDPRPSQLADFPFNRTCVFPSKHAGQSVCPSQIFWGAQTYTDKSRFGPVIDAVDRLGIRENTYIIFSTDNGAQSRHWHGKLPGSFDNAVGTQGPFRGAKASLYEGGHRVPFIVSGPGVSKGRVDHSVLSSVDWLPTIVSLSGGEVPVAALSKLRGADQSSIILGKRHNILERSTGPLHWRGGPGPGPCWMRSPTLAARDGDWKLLINPDFPTNPHGRIELYNVSRFGLGSSGLFFESQNQATARPEVVQRLAEPLISWHQAVGPEHPGSTDKGQSASATACEAFPFPV